MASVARAPVPTACDQGTGSLLEVRDLVVRYAPPPRPPALDGVGFTLEAGAALGIAGESGCGKTTLALSLLRLLPPSASVQGQVRFRGRDVLTLDRRALQAVRGGGIGLVFQEPGLALNPVLRVGDQIAEVVRAHAEGAAAPPPGGAASRREQVAGLLADVGLDATLHSAYPHQLSGGERQRVLIAQALAGRPALLVADEPTAALDAVRTREILALFRRLRERLGIALVLVSHDLRAIAAVTDRVLVAYAGRVVEEGPTAAVFGTPLHPYTQGLVGSLPWPADGRPRRLPTIPGQPGAALPTRGCRFEPRCEQRMEQCPRETPPLFQPGAGRRVGCFRHDSAEPGHAG